MLVYYLQHIDVWYCEWKKVTPEASEPTLDSLPWTLPQCSAAISSRKPSSQYPTYISMTSYLISKRCPDHLNNFYLCLLCVKIVLCPSFFRFSGWNKANAEIFPSEVVFADDLSCCPSLAPPSGSSLSCVYSTQQWSPVLSTTLFEYLHTNTQYVALIILT